MKFIRFSLVFCCVFPCLFGCSKQSNPGGRLDVSGTITFNGGPLAGASTFVVIFESKSNPSSDSSSAPVNLTTGKYLCTMQGGLVPGKYRVRFSADATYDKKTKKPVGADFVEDEFGKGVYSVALLPPEFGKESTIEFEVVAGKRNVFDYNIETSYVPKDTSPP